MHPAFSLSSTILSTARLFLLRVVIASLPLRDVRRQASRRWPCTIPGGRAARREPSGARVAGGSDRLRRAQSSRASPAQDHEIPLRSPIARIGASGSGLPLSEPDPCGFSLFRRAVFPWLGHPVVKSRKSAGICRNLNRFLCFYDAHGFIEIGFVRRIFADFAHPTHLIPVLLHAVWIDHVRPLETIVLAISRPERVISPELRTIPLVGLTSCVL